MFIRKGINFNTSCPHQRGLLNWCMTQTTNFSGFVKDVLFLYRQSNGQFQSQIKIPTHSGDVEFVQDIL